MYLEPIQNRLFLRWVFSLQAGTRQFYPPLCRHRADKKSPLAWQNIEDNPRPLSLANRTKKASELLGRSGLQLPRVPSLNTDHGDFTEAAVRGYRLGYQRQQ